MRRNLILQQSDASTPFGREETWHVVILLHAADAEPSLWRERQNRPSPILGGAGAGSLFAPVEDNSPFLEAWDSQTEERIRRVHGERIAQEVSAMREKFAEREREKRERIVKARVEEEARERRMAEARERNAQKDAQWVAMSMAERRDVLAAKNACPVHELDGRLCPGDRVWDDRCQSHDEVDFLTGYVQGWEIL